MKPNNKRLRVKTRLKGPMKYQKAEIEKKIQNNKENIQKTRKEKYKTIKPLNSKVQDQEPITIALYYVIK